MITLIFVRGDPASMIDRTIEGVSQGDFCHVAVRFSWGIVEALGVPERGFVPGVRLSPVDKYDGKAVVMMKLALPEEAAAEQEARRLLGRLYSYIGCLEGGIYDMTGIRLQPWLNKLIDWLQIRLFGTALPVDVGKWSMNCSETAVRIIRAGGIKVLPGVEADCITPMDLIRYFQSDKGELTMSEETMTTTSPDKTDVTNTSTASMTGVAGVVSNMAGSVVDTAVASGSSSVTNWVSEEIAKLREEMNSTSNFTVAARDRLEIAALEAMSVVALAELKHLAVKLKDKIS